MNVFNRLGSLAGRAVNTTVNTTVGTVQGSKSAFAAFKLGYQAARGVPSAPRSNLVWRDLTTRG